MDLKVPYSNITDKKVGFDAAKKLIPDVIAKFGVKADTKINEATNTIDAKGTGFSAMIQFTETEALVKVDLNFLLKPLKGKILETIERQLKKVV
jgi:Putative polyhydroxyalkanoic acid system protein (PHA_gran_rgn)